MSKGRQTIGDVLVDAIQLLNTNVVLNHIKACISVYMELSQIKDFDPDAINIFAYYRNYLEHKHQSFRRVGWKEKIKGWWLMSQEKYRLKQLLNLCDKKDFGDGDKYLKSMFILIRKAL